jgi:pimeloyl-ACP methyl ester carboxylesterase
MSESPSKTKESGGIAQQAPSRVVGNQRKKSRVVFFGATTAVVILGVSIFLFLRAYPANKNGVDRLYADSVVGVVTLSNELLAEVFGDSVDGHNNAQDYGVRLYEPEIDDWSKISAVDNQSVVVSSRLGSRVVVLVHGLDEPGGIWDQLAPALAGEGHTVLRFDYANDQPIKLSADALLEEILDLETVGVQEIDFVCHSMGGLVTRDAISREVYKASRESGSLRIERLITIGTPHGGSPWARLRAVAEIREQVQRWAESSDLDPKHLLGFARDGVGEAGVDLLPGSDFLIELDQRELDESIAVTCIVGRAINEGGTEFGSVLALGALSELIGKRDAEVVQDEIDTITSELGDGVVPMSSAVLEGVSDVVVLQANHRGLIRHIELEAMIRQRGDLPPMSPPPAIEVVLDRLRR